MKSSDINSFFNSVISTEVLKEILKIDVENYDTLLKKRGSSINLNLTEDEEILITENRLNFLLQKVLNGELTNIHLAYICDCLTLCENINFENETINEIIFDIADPEINGGFKSKKEIEQLILLL
jgi:hypothetical protein